ncbi:TetR/AcrR family transcriptional regulator [Rhizobium sp. ARZ01]|uniref:TetR/AcrR family transcriptional regulator n=1 Tax=Rhizobium sp. ARZ01 TaxID=2769313 RepID=UPI00178555F9|nr:TetR/AcrR family transcriptional regulator [Rhizobium sp. ARZ01]MBD9375044.1 TetR/AcrR family transcriptional regulator [Rhizobium sp. ARZ01]
MADLSAQAAEAARLENVQRILDAAERLFRHYGYTKTNVADIARDLQMSPANIYRFFSSKSEIHQALARRMLQAQYEVLAGNAARPLSASDRLRDHLLLQNRMTVETMMDEEKVHEMVLVAMDQQWSVIQEHLVDLRKLVQGLIEQGIAAGEFREQNPVVAAECFINCGAALCHPQIVSKRISQDEVAEPLDVAEFVLRALR